jgi:hypothetical protein
MDFINPSPEIKPNIGRMIPNPADISATLRLTIFSILKD